MYVSHDEVIMDCMQPVFAQSIQCDCTCQQHNLLYKASYNVCACTHACMHQLLMYCKQDLEMWINPSQ